MLIAFLFFLSTLGMFYYVKKISTNQDKVLEAGKNIMNNSTEKSALENPALPIKDGANDFSAPDITRGEVTAVETDKIEVKQLAETDMRFSFKKDEIKNIVSFEKAPDYSQEKVNRVETKIKELNEKTRSLSSETQNKDGSSPALELKKFLEDPANRLYVENEASWSDLTVGSAVEIKNTPQGKKLVIYSEDLPFNPLGGNQANSSTLPE